MGGGLRLAASLSLLWVTCRGGPACLPWGYSFFAFLHGQKRKKQRKNPPAASAGLLRESSGGSKTKLASLRHVLLLFALVPLSALRPSGDAGVLFSYKLRATSYELQVFSATCRGGPACPPCVPLCGCTRKDEGAICYPKRNDTLCVFGQTHRSAPTCSL